MFEKIAEKRLMLKAFSISISGQILLGIHPFSQNAFEDNSTHPRPIYRMLELNWEQHSVLGISLLQNEADSRCYKLPETSKNVI